MNPDGLLLLPPSALLGGGGLGAAADRLAVARRLMVPIRSSEFVLFVLECGGGK